MNKNFYAVIMAGGSGTRLWPISRCQKPKQFHNLCSPEKSLIQETYERLENLAPKKNIYVSLVQDIISTTREQLKNIPEENFIIEPEIKNTAPAIALVAAKILKINPQAIIATLPSDHTISKIDNFGKTLNRAYNFLFQYPDFLITLGIAPDHANTGYGYIKIGRKFAGQPVYEVEKFVEKPNFATAQKYLSSGDYLWNGGYFIFKPPALLAMYKKNSPKIYQLIQKIIADDAPANLKKYYHQMPSVQIDTAIAEKTKKIAVLPADLGWSDIGNWTTLYEFLTKKTGEPNISRGNHIGIDDENCLIYAQDKLLTTVGLKNIIVVDTPDVTLVCDKNRAQDIKKLIEKVKAAGEHHHL